ncbi:hypothetical protein Bca4012_060588 [Brassica carinata]|uniref:Uncharacterized protein n=1 Tax=Brassica carinata TaxID=52824 RepID=A0A8X7SA20_BRACI|nr:hypothetical protein Bca52824_030919 [Brassica carinata]
MEEVKKVLKDISEREEKLAEVKRNHLAARTEELVTYVVLCPFPQSDFIHTIVLGLYLVGLVSTGSFLLGRLVVAKSTELNSDKVTKREKIRDQEKSDFFLDTSPFNSLQLEDPPAVLALMNEAQDFSTSSLPLSQVDASDLVLNPMDTEKI